MASRMPAPPGFFSKPKRPRTHKDNMAKLKSFGTHAETPWPSLAHAHRPPRATRHAPRTQRQTALAAPRSQRDASSSVHARPPLSRPAPAPAPAAPLPTHPPSYALLRSHPPPVLFAPISPSSRALRSFLTLLPCSSLLSHPPPVLFAPFSPSSRALKLFALRPLLLSTQVGEAAQDATAARPRERARGRRQGKG